MILETFRKHWKSYLGIHIAVNILSLALLTPLATLLIGWLILVSGQNALKDEDILFFALSPTGSVVLLLIAAIFTTMVVFEQAAMLVASQKATGGLISNLSRVGYFMLARIWPLFRLAVHMIARTVLLAAPFLAIAALIFNEFLTEFDINYYLANKPPALWWAGGFILLSLLAMTGLLLRVFSGWVLALPLLLLNRDTPPAALKKSKQASVSIRFQLTLKLLGLLALNMGALGLVSWLADLGVNGAVMLSGNSLHVFAYLLGILLIFWVLSNITITFLSNSILSLLILKSYRHVFGDTDDRIQEEAVSAAQPGRSKTFGLTPIIVLMVIISLVVGLLIRNMMDGPASEDHSQIIAHRGASAEAPENTLAAIELAISQGADWVEIDVQESRDGEVVVIHDSDLKKIGGSNFKVSESSLKQLQSVDIGSWMDSSFSDQRIPTLQQLLVFCKDRVNVIIELKHYGHAQQLEERVAKIVEYAGMESQIVVMSLSYASIQKMKSLRPEWSVGLLSSVTMGDLTRLDVDFFALNAKFANRSFIKRAQQNNQKVLVWTVNDPVSISAMMSKGVDGIITDKPALALQVRQQRTELDLTERLMIHIASFLGKPPPVPEQ